MTTFTIRAAQITDRNWVAQFLDTHWGSTRIVTRGQVYLAHLLPGLIAEDAADPDKRLGLVTYRFDGDECEIMTLDSIAPGQGVGTALLEAVKQAASEAGCRRLWLITTNDNLPALRFYQKRGFSLAAVYPRALDESRRLKPEIPLFGFDGIPLRDEIELEIRL
jgi:GNAT superfamily N-acetyltransferase